AHLPLLGLGGGVPAYPPTEVEISAANGITTPETSLGASSLTPSRIRPELPTALPPALPRASTRRSRGRSSGRAARQRRARGATGRARTSRRRGHARAPP